MSRDSKSLSSQQQSGSPAEECPSSARDQAAEAKQLKLIQEVETRWNSTFYMFNSLLRQIEIVNAALFLLEKKAMCLEPDEEKKIEEAVRLFKLLEEATTEMSSENFLRCLKLLQCQDYCNVN